MEIVFLLEELSAKEFLDEFLPRVLPPEITFRTIPHNGKSDLLRSLPIKLRAWRNPSSKFVVLHDQDANDCYVLKNKLLDVCKNARRDVDPLIRIACHELEAWYLGDFDSLQVCYEGFKAVSHKGKAKFRDVDLLANASQELMRIVPAYQKVKGSRVLGKILKVENNTSKSFNVFMSGLLRLVASNTNIEES